MTLSADAWKGISIASFTIVSISGAALAVILKERAPRVLVSMGIMFSAGVLLAGGFVHLLSDSNEYFGDVGPGGDSYPWAFFTSGLTMVILACVEMIADEIMDRCTTVPETDTTSKTTGALSADMADNNNMVLSPEDKAAGRHPSPQNLGSSDNHCPAVHVDVKPAAVLDCSKAHHKQDQVIPAVSMIPEVEPWVSILLTIVLSIHSIAEGLGVGATVDVVQIESTFVAIFVHKGFTAFALGSSLVSSGYWQKDKRIYFYLSMATFICVTILGIGIGWAISATAAGGGLATAILAGITSGSFIFVSAMEIVPHEMKKMKEHKLPLFPIMLTFLLGYGLMALLALWA